MRPEARRGVVPRRGAPPPGFLAPRPPSLKGRGSKNSGPPFPLGKGAGVIDVGWGRLRIAGGLFWRLKEGDYD